MLHAGDAREDHRLDVAAGAAHLAIAVFDLAAVGRREVQRLGSARALLLALVLAAPEAEHLAAAGGLVAEIDHLVALLGRADVVVPEQLEKISRPRMQQLVVAEAHARTGMFQQRRGAGAVGIENLKRALAVDQRRAVRHAVLGAERGDLLAVEGDAALVLQDGDEAREDGVGGARAV